MTIYQFTIKRDGFRESLQIYAKSMESALREILIHIKDSDILQIERV